MFAKWETHDYLSVLYIACTHSGTTTEKKKTSNFKLHPSSFF